MIAKYSPWVAARAYTWPVEEEQFPFEEPVGFSPPLQEIMLVCRIWCDASLWMEDRVEPGVPFGVNGRERYTAVSDLELGLVLQHQAACNSIGRGLGEPDDCIMRDDRPGFKPR